MNNNIYLVLIAVFGFAVFVGISLKICDKGEDDEKNDATIIAHFNFYRKSNFELEF